MQTGLFSLKTVNILDPRVQYLFRVNLTYLNSSFMFLEVAGEMVDIVHIYTVK